MRSGSSSVRFSRVSLFIVVDKLATALPIDDATGGKEESEAIKNHILNENPNTHRVCRKNSEKCDCNRLHPQGESVSEEFR